MARLGFVIELLLPLALLAVNAVLGYGGVLVTIVLLVWVATGILLKPTPDEEHQPLSYKESPGTDNPTHPSIDRTASGGTLTHPPCSSPPLDESRPSPPA